jgi:hypothetical protein
MSELGPFRQKDGSYRIGASLEWRIGMRVLRADVEERQTIV